VVSTLTCCVPVPCAVQGAFAAWRQLCQSLSALRSRAHRMLSAVLLSWRRQQAASALQFWCMYTACRISERLSLQLPMFRHRLPAFDAWLWRHTRRRQLSQQAAGLVGRLSLVHALGERRGSCGCCCWCVRSVHAHPPNCTCVCTWRLFPQQVPGGATHTRWRRCVRPGLLCCCTATLSGCARACVPSRPIGASCSVSGACWALSCWRGAHKPPGIGLWQT
jgi:hypothetical protein